MIRAFVSVMLLSVLVYGQPLDGPRILLDSSQFQSPTFDVNINGQVRLLWLSENGEVFTAEYNWPSATFTESPHSIYQSTQYSTLPIKVRRLENGDWISVLAQKSQIDTPRIIGISCRSGQITVRYLIQDSAPFAYCIPLVQFNVIDLVAREGGGEILVLSEEHVVYYDDYYDNAAYRRVLFFYDEDFTLQSNISNDSVFFGDNSTWHNVSTSVARDSVVFVHAVEFNQRFLFGLNATEQTNSPKIIMNGPQFWPDALLKLQSGRLILFTSGGTFEVNSNGICEQLGLQWSQCIQYDVHPSYGGLFAGGGTAGTNIEIIRIDTNGTYVVPIGAVDLGIIYPITRDIYCTRFADSTVYVLWTQGRNYSPTAIGMFRVGWREPVMRVENHPITVPDRFNLSAFPNPFNSEAQIAYDLPQAQKVELAVFNVLGQKVATLLSGFKPAGSYKEIWKPETGTGIYFVRIKADESEQTRKVMYLR